MSTFENKGSLYAPSYWRRVFVYDFKSSWSVEYPKSDIVFSLQPFTRRGPEMLFFFTFITYLFNAIKLCLLPLPASTSGQSASDISKSKVFSSFCYREWVVVVIPNALMTNNSQSQMYLKLSYLSSE